MFATLLNEYELVFMFRSFGIGKSDTHAGVNARPGHLFLIKPGYFFWDTRYVYMCDILWCTSRSYSKIGDWESQYFISDNLEEQVRKMEHGLGQRQKEDLKDPAFLQNENLFPKSWSHTYFFVVVSRNTESRC